MLRTVPWVGLIPLFIIWMGIGEAPKVALIALGTAFHLYLNVYAGIRGVDEQLIEAGGALGLGRWGLVRHVTRIKAQQLVAELWQRRGCAVLLVTHDVDEALLLADRVLVMDEGRIAYDTEVGLERPRSVSDAGFAQLRERLLGELGVS